MVIENRDLAAGTKLVAKYKGEQWTLEVLPGEPKTYGFVGKRPKDAAQVYKSPSAAGSAVMGGTACNGWRFWSLADGETAPVATTKGRSKAAPKPSTPANMPKTAARRRKEQAKPSILHRHDSQGDLDPGQVRWVCNACLKNFIVEGDATQEVCPEGHRNDDPELNGAPAAEAVAADKAEAL